MLITHCTFCSVFVFARLDVLALMYTEKRSNDMMKITIDLKDLRKYQI